MSDFAILTRLYLAESWGAIKNGKKKKKRAVAGVFYILILAVYLVGCMCVSAFTLTNQYVQLGVPQLTIFNGAIFGFMVTFFMGILRGATVVKNTDAEMLLSLPIKRTSIILAKSISKYLLQLAFTAALFLPYIVAYFWLGGAPVVHLLRGLLVCLIIPLLAVGMEYLLNSLFFALGGKIRNAQALSSGLSILFLVGFLFVNFSFNSNYATTAEEAIAQMHTFAPARWCVEFVAEGNLLSLLFLLLLTVIPFVLGLRLYARNYGVKQRTFRSSKTGLDFRSHTPMRALLRNESARYFGSSAYLVNTIFGIVIMVVLTIVLLFLPKDNIIFELASYQAFASYLPLLVGAVYSFFPAITTISASAISMEGRQIWLIKSLPLSVRDIFVAKIGFNVLITVIPSFLCSLAGGLLLGIAAQDLWIVVLLPVLSGFAISICGLYINLCHPKLDWDNEAKVVKQSMAAGLTLLVGFVIVLFPLVLYLTVLVDLIAPSVMGLLWVVAELVFIAIYILLLKTKGVKCYLAL